MTTAAAPTLDILQRLLAATPLPPEDADVDTLLAAIAELLPARQVILDELGDQRRVGSDAERTLAREVAARDAAWHAALARARDGLGLARIGVGKLRHYAGVSAER